MDEATWEVVKELFHGALPLAHDERVKLLAPCDEAIRSEVESLLAAHELAGAGRTAGADALQAPGTIIDRYELLRQIGEGGFGVVYIAQQTEPVRRQVALKVIKRGMDTKQVIARFEAERQALALMAHPNIAKVLDAGATERGRPYFVMELVDGVPITDYCDRASLAVRERLDLFVQVCSAVQHAHQKGIIHRDIKPSNVLVTERDGTPVPKVIDFGIAKATDHRLTAQTLFTERHQMVGTPEYMSPEQTGLNGLDVDSRTDIYSLGVLLYELLTGTKPFEFSAVRESGYEEMLRHIRDVDPPKPSTRVSTLGRTRDATARHRRTPSGALANTLRGDLDWIVMKALEKDRTRRYDTANGLAMDIGRHLRDEPVLAGRPSASYRVRKYVRRHRIAVTATAIVVCGLGAGLAVAVSGHREAIDAREGEAHQRGIAEARLDLEYEELCRRAGGALARASARSYGRAAPETASQILERAVTVMPARHEAYLYRALDPGREPGERLADLDEAHARGLSEGSYLRARSRALYDADRRDEAEQALVAAADIPRADVTSAVLEARARRAFADGAAADRLLTEALAGSAGDHPLHRLALVLRAETRAAAENLSGALVDRLALQGGDEDDIANRVAIALLWRRLGRSEDAQKVFEQTVESVREINTESAWADLGNDYGNAGQRDWVVDVCEAAHEVFPASPRFLMGKAQALMLQDSPDLPGRYEEALAAAQEAVRLDETYAVGHRLVGALLVRLRRHQEALDAFDEAEAHFGHVDGEVQILRAEALIGLGNADAAVAILAAARAAEPKSIYVQRSAANLYLRLDRPDDVIEAALLVVADRPTDSFAHVMLGEAYKKKHEWLKARDAYVEARRLGWDSLFVRMPLADVYLKLGSPTEALHMANLALELDDDHPAALLTKANVLNEMKQFPEALELVDAGLERGGEGGAALLLKGRILFSMGRPKLAEDALRRSLEFGSPHKPYEILGRALWAQGRHEEALTAMRRAAEIDPTCAATFFHLGWMQQLLGDLPTAIDAYDRAYANDTSDVTPLTNATIAYLGLGDWDNARVTIEKALPGSYSNTQNHLIHGDILVHFGEMDEALAAFERSIALDQKNVEAHISYVDALRVMERVDEALTAVENAVATPDVRDVRLDARHVATLVDAGRHEDALEVADTAVSALIAAGPSDEWSIVSSALAAAAVAFEREARFESVQACCELGLQLAPDDAGFLGETALAAAHLGDSGAAHDALRRATAGDATRLDAEFVRRQVHALLLIGDVDAAVAATDAAYAQDAAAFAFERVRTLRAAGRAEEAAACARERQADGPALGGRDRQAYVLAVAGRSDDARQLLSEAEPVNALQHLQYARVLFVLGDRDAAGRLLDTARDAGLQTVLSRIADRDLR